MANQKIQDKEKAILDAAIAVFAARGFWNTPTSLISKTAGVADGTLFNYFASKDDLINAVYLDIKHELAERIMVDFPRRATFRDKAWHMWSRYIEWGVEQPEKFKVMQQIHGSFEVSAAAQAEGIEPFIEFEQAARESSARGEIRAYPVEFLGALMNSHSNMTVEYIRMSGDPDTDYKAIGFEILWNGITS
jgi:AcrR family transcriptional regulator